MPKKSRIGKIIGSWVQQYIPEKRKRKITTETKGLPFNTTGRGFSFEEFVSPNTLGQMQNFDGWTYACVTKIAQTIAQAQLNLYEQKNDTNERITRHDAIDLIEHANDAMNLYDLLEITTIYHRLTGEAYWWKERGANGKVIGLYPWFIPAYMRVIPGNDSFYGGFVYRIPETGEEISFKSEDIVYFRFPDPLRKLRGTSPVKAQLMILIRRIKRKDITEISLSIMLIPVVY